jgi:hypothetical protein
MKNNNKNQIVNMREWALTKIGICRAWRLITRDSGHTTKMCGGSGYQWPQAAKTGRLDKLQEHHVYNLLPHFTDLQNYAITTKRQTARTRVSTLQPVVCCRVRAALHYGSSRFRKKQK